MPFSLPPTRGGLGEPEGKGTLQGRLGGGPRQAPGQCQVRFGIGSKGRKGVLRSPHPQPGVGQQEAVRDSGDW